MLKEKPRPTCYGPLLYLKTEVVVTSIDGQGASAKWWHIFLCTTCKGRVRTVNRSARECPHVKRSGRK